MKLLKELKETWDNHRWKKFQYKRINSLEKELDGYKQALKYVQESFDFSLEEHKYRTLFIGDADRGMYHRVWNDYLVQLESLKIETLTLKINHVEYLLKRYAVK